MRSSRRVNLRSRAEARSERTKHRFRLCDRLFGVVRDGPGGDSIIRLGTDKSLHVRLATRRRKAQPELGDRFVPTVDVPRQREVSSPFRVDAGGVVTGVVGKGRSRRVRHPC